MSQLVRFVAAVLPNAPWDVLKQRAQYVEQLGFDVLATADHFVDWSNPSSPWFEGWTLLTAWAGVTSRIRLATYVTQIPLRSPAMLARQALTLDHVSNGRLDVGLGTGVEFDPLPEMIGIPRWTSRERVDRFTEYVAIVDSLLSQETSSYAGEFYTTQDAVMNPRPVQHPRPPFVIAAMAPRMLRLAARYADTWNSVSIVEGTDRQLAESAERMQRIDEYCLAINRDPATLRRSFVLFDPHARTSGGMLSYYQSEDAFADIAARAIELGLTEICMYYPFRDEQLPMFERIATDVFPRLRQLVATPIVQAAGG